VLQLDVNKGAGTLASLQRGQSGVIESFDLPGDIVQRMMELGFVPGAHVTAGRGAPGGDPKVFRIDGAEFALRRETAAAIRVRPVPERT